MAGGRETTRQKMINIMYLVLLAMLALNVSDTILNAFKNINDSLDASKTNVSTSLDQLFSAFQNTELKNKPERAKPIWEKANKARAYADELNKEIQRLKNEFRTAGEGIDEETGDFVLRENMDIAQNIMLNKKEGQKLKAKINETRAKLISLLDAKAQRNVSFSLEAKDSEKPINGKKKWEEINFGEGTPLTAANTILTKIQADLKNAEAEVVKRLFSEMNQNQMTLDVFKAVAVPSGSYVIQGQPYKAEVFLTASDSKSNPSISVGGNSLNVKDGVGTYTGSTNAVGSYTWRGTIRVKQADGEIKIYETQPITYQVAKPSATVSSTNLNVIYAGIANPFSISAPGFSLESIKASISAGSLSGSAGKYMVNVPGSMVGKEVTINVSGTADGKSLSLGSNKFRVKPIPNPTAKFAGRMGGIISGNKIVNEGVVVAAIEDFEFDVKIPVLRFTVVIAKPRQDAQTYNCQGSALSAQAKSAMSSLPYQSRVYVENIQVQLPDGRTPTINSMVFTVN
ncbi:type IX secretion system motor protein PorM/GldM [Pedobacter insulae]|uniref:Gliding motility-associated protein GldM n=1 Tax=Pedobacter insulae TaxID=414048 RepID=A0A1I2TGK9_9SPHI|nr:gliding motility protein GldM [Pedobacter insulae]SFG63993.1 gliding motility-associated protein GldM [Pedobacter insulae]